MHTSNVWGLTLGALALALSRASAPEVPRLAAVVNDFANVLAAHERETLERDLVQFPSLRAFAAELFKNDGRGIGDAKRNNGLLVVLAVHDREVWITPGLGIEKTVTDKVAADVTQQMAFEFRRGAYFQGLRGGVEALRRVVEAARNRQTGPS